jgi:hypothetical protein
VGTRNSPVHLNTKRKNNHDATDEPLQGWVRTLLIFAQLEKKYITEVFTIDLLICWE